MHLYTHDTHMQVAIALTVVTLALILPWRENYGGEEGKPLTTDDSTTASTTADKTEVDSTTDSTAKKTPKKRATTRKSTQNDDNTNTTPLKDTPPPPPTNTNPPEINASSAQTLGQWVVHVAAVMKAHPVILCLGLSQAVFEGAVYTFGKRAHVCMCDLGVCIFICMCISSKCVYKCIFYGYYTNVCFIIIAFYMHIGIHVHNIIHTRICLFRFVYIS